MPLLREDRSASAIFSLLAEELSAAGITFRFQAVGQSMYPTICNGEMLYVEPLGGSKLACGDIVLFRRTDGLKAHRIVKIRGAAYATRGDSSLQDDGEVRRDQILGRVIGKEGGNIGKPISLAGLLPRTRFRIRRLRSKIGRLISWRRDSQRAIVEPTSIYK